MGGQSLTAAEEELAELRSEVRGLVDEILHKLNMTDRSRGIGNLITSHTLDFVVRPEVKSTMRPRRRDAQSQPKTE